MTPQIVEKIQAEINVGINKESQVVYLLAGVRKIIEQEEAGDRYTYLKFHCNWTLHSRLQGSFAQQVLSHFGAAHLQLLKGDHLTSNSEIEKISKMSQFREELSDFFCAHSITDFSKSPDEWPRFLYLYARVIEDTPLLIRADNSAPVREVAVSVEMAKELTLGQHVFKVMWRVTDRDGRSGTIFVNNTFQADK
jgi:hypothetical protein